MNKINRIGATILAIAVALLLSGRLSAGQDPEDAKAEADAEQAIKELDGKITRDEKGGAIIIVKIHGKYVSQARLKALARLKSLQKLGAASMPQRGHSSLFGGNKECPF